MCVHVRAPENETLRCANLLCLLYTAHTHNMHETMDNKNAYTISSSLRTLFSPPSSFPFPPSFPPPLPFPRIVALCVKSLTCVHVAPVVTPARLCDAGIWSPAASAGCSYILVPRTRAHSATKIAAGRGSPLTLYGAISFGTHRERERERKIMTVHHIRSV